MPSGVPVFLRLRRPDAQCRPVIINPGAINNCSSGTGVAVSRPMSGDEGLVAFISAGLGLVALVRWYFFLGSLGDGVTRNAILGIAPPAALVLLFFILKNFASWDVRDSGIYLGMYM